MRLYYFKRSTSYARAVKLVFSLAETAFCIVSSNKLCKLLLPIALRCAKDIRFKREGGFAPSAVTRAILAVNPSQP